MVRKDEALEKLIQPRRSLKSLNSWRVGGSADYYSCPNSVAETCQVLGHALSTNWPITILGHGTNVLVADEGVEGIVVDLRRLRGISILNQTDVLEFEALVGTSKAELSRLFLSYELSPAIFLSGIPGTVGGGVVMNAGVSSNVVPKEFSEVVSSVEFFDWHTHKVRTLSKSELSWSYRKTTGWQPGTLLKVRFSWPMKPQSDIHSLVQAHLQLRSSTQPLTEPSCGSVFKNPPNQKSGQLIEQAGLKGFQIGGAQVSTKHANFIVTRSGATATDVQSLIETVKNRVFSQFGVELETEVIWLGRWAS